MKMTRRSLWSLLAGAWIGPARADERPIVLGGEQDFVDIDLPLTATDMDATGTYRAIGRGLIDGAPCGFAIRYETAWKPSTSTDIDIRFGNAVLSSIGAPSDRFVALLEKLYKLPISGKPMVANVVVGVASLGTDPTQLGREAVRTKLFFYADAAEDRYGEVFLNIDPQTKLIEFHDKDSDYHMGILRALTEPPPLDHAGAAPQR